MFVLRMCREFVFLSLICALFEFFSLIRVLLLIVFRLLRVILLISRFDLSLFVLFMRQIAVASWFFSDYSCRSLFFVFDHA